MNKKLSLKQIGCLAIVILLAGMIAAISNGYYERKVVFDQRAKIVGSIAKKEPERLDKIMIALKDEDQESKAYGKAILEKYGYQEKEMGIVSIQNLSIELLVSIGLIIVLGVLWQREKRRQDKRIESLSSYLNQGINGQSKIQVKGTEDEFALLEDELYKTVNELYQTRETALKEKVVLKDHLADIMWTDEIRITIKKMGNWHGELFDGTKGEALHFIKKPVIYALGIEIILVAFLIYMNESSVSEFLPFLPIGGFIGFTVAVIASIGLAYLVGSRKIRTQNITQVIQDETL